MRYFLIFFFAIITRPLFAQPPRAGMSDAILADTHNDFLSKSVEDRVVFDTDLKGITQSDLFRMRAAGLNVQVFSIFCDGNYGRGSAFSYANRELDSLFAIVSRNPK